jgi:SAM-dependent methyltransferase
MSGVRRDRFLAAAAEAGWAVTGVEPLEVLASYAKEALRGRGEVHCSTLQEANLGRSFDALTFWDVLEHVTEPLAFLADCAGLLKPGGYLFANLPDIGSIQARLLGDRWPLLLAEHLNCFDRSTLKLCGEKAGLQWVALIGARRHLRWSMSCIDCLNTEFLRACSRCWDSGPSATSKSVPATSPRSVYWSRSSAMSHS